MSDKSKKKKDKKRKKSEDTTNQTVEKPLSKLDVLEMIDDLKMQKQSLITIKNYLEAVKKSEEIIDLANKYEMSSIVAEEEDFIKRANQETEKEREKKEFAKRFKTVSKRYNSFVTENKIESAHKLIEDFTNYCENYPEFSDLPEVNDLVMKDAKIWINYITEKQLKEESSESERSVRIYEEESEEKLKIRKEIKESAELSNFFFKKLIAENSIEKAHKFIMEFVQKYENYPFFSTIPEVENLLNAEAKIWINYITEKQISEDSTQIRGSVISKEGGRKSDLLLEVEQNCQGLNTMFDKLTSSGNLEEANRIVENFENHYKDKIDLSSIPCVHKLLLKRDQLLKQS